MKKVFTLNGLYFNNGQPTIPTKEMVTEVHQMKAWEVVQAGQFPRVGYRVVNIATGESLGGEFNTVETAQAILNAHKEEFIKAEIAEGTKKYNKA